MKPIYGSAIVLASLLAASTMVSAQVVKIDSTSNWKKSLKAGLNLNQAAFSGNWKAGGINSLGLNGLFNYKASYRKGKHSWDNELDLLYGMINNDGQGYRKTADRFYFDTKYGREISSQWSAFAAMNILSQFTKGYKYVKDAAGIEQGLLISDSFAPAFITLSLGMEWKPAPYFKWRFAPLAPRLTMLRNNDGRYSTVDPKAPYGVTVGKSERWETYAFNMVADFDKDIATGVNLKVRYVMFANYETLEANKVDHRVDLSLTGKIGKFFNVNLTGIFIYDYDQDHSPQYSQVISLGLLYTFQNFESK